MSTPAQVRVAIPLPPHVGEIAEHGARQIVDAIARKAPHEDRSDLLLGLAVAVTRGSDAERQALPELAAAVRDLMAGDESAIGRMRDWTEAHSPVVVVEPSAEVRRLANRYDCEQLLEQLRRGGQSRQRRLDLVLAIGMRSGMDRAEHADPEAIEEMVAILPALVAGDPEALDTAAEWIATNVRTSAPWESSR